MGQLNGSDWRLILVCYDKTVLKGSTNTTRQQQLAPTLENLSQVQWICYCQPIVQKNEVISMHLTTPFIVLDD
jgi:hypothetical protein